MAYSKALSVDSAMRGSEFLLLPFIGAEMETKKAASL
jgi:hypothetical protein